MWSFPKKETKSVQCFWDLRLQTKKHTTLYRIGYVCLNDFNVYIPLKKASVVICFIIPWDKCNYCLLPETAAVKTISIVTKVPVQNTFIFIKFSNLVLRINIHVSVENIFETKLYNFLYLSIKISYIRHQFLFKIRFTH